MAGIDCTAGGNTTTKGSGSNGSANGGAGAGSSGTLGGGVTSFASSTGTGSGTHNGNAYQTQPICTMGSCTDFPDAPIMADMAVPANAPMMFGAADNFTAPSGTTPLCVLEPQLSAGSTEGAMIPANWVEPRFRINASGLNLFEIRITSLWEKSPLVVYTTQTEWYMPRTMWTGTQDLDAGYASGTGLGNNAANAPLTVTVRGINTATPGMKPVGVSGDFNIAPVVATGSLVFWTVNSAQVTPTSSQLFGFKVGDEGVQVALTLGQVAWAGQPGEDGAELRGFYAAQAGFTEGQVQCMGCHTGTPDGSAVVFTDNWSWVKGAALLPGAAAVAGAIPTAFNATDVTTPATIAFGRGAQAMFKTPWWGTQTMSPSHWQPGDAIVVSSYGTSYQGSPPSFATGTKRTKVFEGLPHYDTTNSFNDDKVNYHTLAWINMESTATIDTNFLADPTTNGNAYGSILTNREMQAEAAEGTAWGLIATGDTLSDVMPSLSNQAATDTIAYTLTDFSPDGHPDYTATQASIRTVAYNKHAGGTSQPLMGASDSAHLNYYPAYSSDDKFIAFTQAPVPSATSPDGPYYNRFGQIMLIPSGGGTAISLAANEPNSCAGDNVATGIINSWPKWSPDVITTATMSDAGKTYYFLIFSSGRTYKDEFSEQFTLAGDPLSNFKGLQVSSQLYLAAIVVDNATQKVTTYPAVYIWNQNRTPGAPKGVQYSNLTPAWAPFALPPLVIPPPVNTN